MWRVKLSFCIDRDDADINGRIIDGMREMLTANLKDDLHFIPKEDHETLCKIIPGLTHLEFHRINGKEFRKELRGHIMGCDRLTDEERHQFLGLVDLMEDISEEQVVANKHIPGFFETTKKVEPS